LPLNVDLVLFLLLILTWDFDISWVLDRVKVKGSRLSFIRVLRLQVRVLRAVEEGSLVPLSLIEQPQIRGSPVKV